MKEQAIVLRESGESIKEIAKKLGRSPSTVHAWVKNIPVSQETMDILSKRGPQKANQRKSENKAKRIAEINLTPLTVRRDSPDYDPKGIGDRSEARIMAEFLDAGMDILVPFGDRNRYDLVIDDSGKFIRIQCKTARLIGDKFVFKTESNNWNSGKRRGYVNEIEFFAVFLRENRKVYIFSPGNLPKGLCVIRLDKSNTGNNGTRFAEDYEFVKGKKFSDYK
jgi:transposase-like protein